MPNDPDVADDLATSIAKTLNKCSAENASNTPDYILAQFLLGCLKAFGQATRDRDGWYGIAPKPGHSQKTIEPAN